MLETTLALLRCPNCSSSAALEPRDAVWVEVEYADGARREMSAGRLTCEACGADFPVQDFVPSFASALPRDVRADADYWGRYYAGEVAKGNLTFMEPDLARRGRDGNAYDPERFLLEHPLLRGRGICLDLGCGSGWTTLMLGRAGFTAIGVEPAMASLVEAKRYSMQQRTPVDYVCGAPGYIRFNDGTVDQVFAFHSLHHVPDLLQVMPQIVGWLRVGGVLAVDEHVQSQPQYWQLAGLIGKHLGVPQGPPATGAVPSANEDCSRAAVLPAIAAHFRVEDLRFRQVAFDSVADWVPEAAGHEAAVRRLVRAHSLAVAEWRPGEAEYATVLAVKGASNPTRDDLSSLAEKAPADLLPLFDCSQVSVGGGGHTWAARIRRGLALLAKRGPKALLREAAGYWYWRLGS